MLLLERANRAQTTKFYIGDVLRFRLVGEENYWYERTITDILPETNTLMLDNFAVKLPEIQTLKMRRKPIWRIVGGAAFSLGATPRVGYHDWSFWLSGQNGGRPPHFTASLLGPLVQAGYLNTPRKLKLGKKHRLRDCGGAI
jgi:hypothetical protein